MINEKKIVVILPAYNASKTLEKTVMSIPKNLVDDLILTDDFSNDNTIEIAEKIGIKHIIKHEKNMGYGANQKTCYDKALSLNADIILMLHPDYQYDPKLIPSMCYLIDSGLYDIVLGSRILGKGALNGGMPHYKYFFNRILTFIQNLLMGQNLSEYHTGYRCFSSEILKKIPYNRNSNNFIFDNELLSQCCFINARIGEISCPSNYFPEASSINFFKSIVYGIGVLRVSISFFLHKKSLLCSKLYLNL